MGSILSPVAGVTVRLDEMHPVYGFRPGTVLSGLSDHEKIVTMFVSLTVLISLDLEMVYFSD